ncbi:MAG: chorismate synthase [SAR202 cluster bacterium]|jgi:chorismate synthase|nr:chorismate synthase [SAR202 cluster bacterium]|tara:strand:+ start:24117 stop:25190 length:1074 start_codon:yes stop_codon:yes gene_type:complete
MSNTFGNLFRITTWGESHGDAIGVVIDGCPPLISLSEEDIQLDLDRRKPGQSEISTQRKEDDKVIIESGVFEGKTLGTPIHLVVRNNDMKSKDYNHMKDLFRPSHADYTYQAKYGIRNWKGGGRASARETIGRVAGGAIAKKILKNDFGIEILAYVKQISNIKTNIIPDAVLKSDIDSNIVRCPEKNVAEKMIDYIKVIRKKGDSLGGIIEGIARNVPVGLGEPVFGKIDAELARAMLSLPACKGFEIGSGFSSANMTGSEHNDEFYNDNGIIRTKTNNSGGVQGGISNGENIIIRAAFKPTATIMSSQKTVNDEGKPVEMQGRGRHDPCVLPRAVPLVEAMIALVLVDYALIQKTK